MEPLQIHLAVSYYPVNIDIAEEKKRAVIYFVRIYGINIMCVTVALFLEGTVLAPLL